MNISGLSNSGSGSGSAPGSSSGSGSGSRSPTTLIAPNILVLFIEMKFNLEIIVSMIVLFILYLKPSGLTRFSNTVLGKTTLLLGVIYVSCKMGKLAGLLSALVMIVLIYENVEGFDDDPVSSEVLLAKLKSKKEKELNK